MSKADEILKEKYGFEYKFKPDPLSKKALPYLKPGSRLLDAGCREGADSVFYAKKGFEVTAIDSDKEYLKRLRNFKEDHGLSNISIWQEDLVNYSFPTSYYDVIICLLVGCCMKKSDFERMLAPMKRSLKPGGVMVMSVRNYLDCEYKEYLSTERMIEPNTFLKKDDCCKIRYYIEKGRLLELFSEFDILYYYEGPVPDKYEEVQEHGDSHIICRRTA